MGRNRALTCGNSGYATRPRSPQKSESVGTAIEVKSDVSNQWDEVTCTATALGRLRQKLSGITVKDDGLTIEKKTKEPVPFYAVGYEGWSTSAILEERARNAPVDGILVLKPKIFAWSDRRAYLRRLAECEDELQKKQRGETFNETLAACAWIVGLTKTDNSTEEIVSALNSDNWSVKPIHFEGLQPFPLVDAGNWTEETLQNVTTVFQLKTKVLKGDEALLQFVNVIHQEVAKRAAMSVDLLDYAS